MIIGGYDAPVDPDNPTVLTFYMGLYTPGRPAGEQGVIGPSACRDELRRLRAPDSPEDDDDVRARRLRRAPDIAGIVLNRWGHARLVQPPGFYYGRDGRPSAREIVAKGYGRIAIGHSELGGHQSATGAMGQGKRLGEWAATA